MTATNWLLLGWRYVTMPSSHVSFYKNALWQYGLQAAKYVLPLITLPYLTRVLEPEGYAFYAYVVSFMAFAQVLVDFGFNLSGTKRIAAAASTGEESRVVGAVTQARLVLCLVAGALVMVVAHFLPMTRGHALYVFIAFLAVCGKGLLPDFLFQGHEQMGPITTRFLVSKGLSTALTFVFVRSMGDILWVPVLDVLSNGVALAWSFAAARRRFGTSVAWVPMGEALRELGSSGLYCFSNMAASVFSGFTTLLIGAVVEDASLVAYWSLSMTAVSAVQSLYTPVTNSLYPHMVNTADWRYARRLALLAAPAVLAGTVAFALLADPIMLVLGGAGYAGGAWVLAWVSPVLFFSFFAMLLGWPVLGAAGKVAEVTKSTVTSALFCIAALLAAAALGAATLQVVCVIRCATEALLFLVRFVYALPVLRGEGVAR